MPLLIDGYNLLNVVGIVSPSVGPGGLQRSRLALLNFLAESLEPEEVSGATVVFDAHDPPPGRPRVLDHRGLTVRFASQHEDADALIEELIRADSAPRRLTVVSSDHRLHRAARRRKATAIDSDAWYDEIVRRRHRRRQSAAEASARPPVPLLEEDVNYWIRQFGGQSLLEELIAEGLSEDTTAPEEPDTDEPPGKETASDKPSADEAAEIGNPFPPGYAEDLLEEDELSDPLNLFPPGYREDVNKE